MFRKECLLRGMKIPPAADIGRIEVTKKGLEKRIKGGKNENYNFMFFVTNESITFLHGNYSILIKSK